MNPTNKPTTINLGGETLNLTYDINAFAAFEKVTGKFFIDFLVEMQESVAKLQAAIGDNMRRVKAGEPALPTPPIRLSTDDFRAFIWSCNMVYGKNKQDPDEPSWPKTISGIGRLLDINTIPKLLPVLLGGATANMADKEDKPKANGDAAADPQMAAPVNDESLPISGGAESGSLEEDALGSLTPKLVV